MHSRYAILHRADRRLTLLLVGALAAPLAAALTGAAGPTAPFGLSRMWLAALLLAVLLAHFVLGRLARNGRALAREAVVWLTFTVGAAELIRLRANAFYTAQALLEGLTALLVLNLVARLAQRLARRAAADEPRGTHPALAVADRLVSTAFWLTVAVFAFMLVSVREAAGVALIVAVALHAPVILLRMPDATRGLVASTHDSPRHVRVRYHIVRRRLGRRRRARRDGRPPSPLGA